MFPSPKPEESGGLSQHFNNNVDHGDKDDDKKKGGNGQNKKKGAAATKATKDTANTGKADKAPARSDFNGNHMNQIANGYALSGYNGDGNKHEENKKGKESKHTSNHAGPSYGGGGAKKRMKSKKSGGVKTNHDHAQQDHGFHNHQFEQRNAPASAHHGIVGIKHQSSAGAQSNGVKTAGGSQARTRTTTTGE